MFVLYLILSILICIFGALYYIHLIVYKDLRNLPGPSLFSYVQNLFKAVPSAEDAFEQLMNLNGVYGSVVKIWMNPFQPKLVVSNLQYVKQLLSSHSHVQKTKMYDYFDTFAGLGLGTSPVELWRTHRKQLNLAFRTKTLEKYEEIFEQFGQQLVKELKQKANGITFDILTAVNLISLHIIYATLMQTTTRNELNNFSKYFEARESFYRILVDRSLSIMMQFDFLFKRTKTYTKHEQCAKILNGFSERIVEDYRRRIKGSKFDEDKHVIDIIFEICDMGSKEMIDHISTFIVGGHETVSVALSFSLYELAKLPETQNKIIKEIYTVLGENIGGVLKFSDLQNLKYLECVIKETMRMYPIVPVIERKTTEDMEIDGVRIPKGTEILIAIYNVHRDEKNHPNSNIFDPDRFLPENEHKITPFSYLPFSLGPRNCIGKQFGMLEMKYLLTKILWNYEVFPVETKTKMRFLSELTLKSSIGMPIRLIPRNVDNHVLNTK